MASIAIPPPAAQQKACVADHKRIFRVTKDTIRIQLDGEDPIYLTGHGICTASTQDELDKIIKFRGAPPKRKADTQDEAAAAPEEAPAPPAKQPRQEERSSAKDYREREERLRDAAERQQVQYWDELLGVTEEEQMQVTAKEDSSVEELDEHGNPLPYWATRVGRAEYFNENGDPVFQEDIDAGRAPPNPNCYTVEDDEEEDEEEQVQAAVERCTADAIADAIAGETSEGAWAE